MGSSTLYTEQAGRDQLPALLAEARSGEPGSGQHADAGQLAVPFRSALPSCLAVHVIGETLSNRSNTNDERPTLVIVFGPLSDQPVVGTEPGFRVLA